LIFKNTMSRTNIGTGKAKGAGSHSARQARGRKERHNENTNQSQKMNRRGTTQSADVQRAGLNPPQRDGGETYEPAPLRYMRSARSGPSDDSLSWVVGKKTRAELVVRGNKAGPSGMSNYDHRVALTVDFS
jgi:hypothetical protein